MKLTLIIINFLISLRSRRMTRKKMTTIRHPKTVRMTQMKSILTYNWRY